MYKIGSGIAVRHGSGVWNIVDAAGSIQATFNHAQFPHIVDGTPVYFIDLNLDGICEKVQVQLDVDQLVTFATPTNGYENGAELRLRNYIMDALYASLRRTGTARTAYRASLDQRMAEIQRNANALPSKKVTIALLKKMLTLG